MGRVLALLVAMLSIAASPAVLAGPAGGEGRGAPAGLEGGEEGGAPAEAAGGGRGWTSPDGVHWEGPDRLTDNAAEDSHPQLAASSNGSFGVVWGRGSAFMFMRINRTGAVLTNEKQIALTPVPVQYSGFVSPYIGVDSKGCFHITFKPETYSVAYAKYDAYGNNLVPQKTVPSGATSPHAPSLAVSRNDIVHIVYEDLRFGGEAVTYARLLNDGTIDKDGVRISAGGWVCSGSTICTDFANNVHSAFIVQGTSGLGAWHAKLDNFGNPLPQAPPVYVFNATAAGPFESVFPPTIHADATGAVHLAWNDRSQGIGRLMYMKLDNNGNKLAAGADGEGIPLTISPTVKGFPSITSDAYGTAYVFWADNRNGNDQIWYVPVVPGRENDTGLPNRAVCLNRDTSGSAKEPFAARDPDGQLHVVWSDSRDGNWEIYHLFGIKSAVEVRMTSEEMYKLMYISPNETRSGNLTVRNLGGLNDTVHLNITANLNGHQGWKVKLEAADIMIGPNETRRLRVSVTGAPLGMSNDYISTTVSGYCDGDPDHKRTVSFRTYLVVDRKLGLSCDGRSRVTGAGVPAEHRLVLQNLGSLTEAIDITAEGPPDWNWTVEPARSTLEPKKDCLLLLTVTPPPDALGGEVGMVAVKARLASTPAVEAAAHARTVVGTAQGLALETDRESAEVLPGGTAVFLLMVDHLGNAGAPVMFLLEASHDGPGWTAELDAEAVSLNGGENAFVVLAVTAPMSAPEGFRLAVAARAFNEEGTLEARCSLSVVVGKVRGLAASVRPEEVSLPPGGTAVYSIDVSNAGNGPDEVRPGGCLAPLGWRLSLALPNGMPLEGDWSLAVKAGEAVSVAASLEAPAGAPAGSSSVDCRFQDGAGGLLRVELKARVAPVRSASAYSPSPTAHCTPGGTARFPVALLNRGNAGEVFALGCTGLPEGWPAPELLDAEGSPLEQAAVPAFSTTNFTVIVRVPASTRADLAGLEVLGDGGGGLLVSASLTVVVEKADLVIASVVPSARYPRPGELVIVNVTVSNLGTGPAHGAVMECHRQGEAVVERALGDLGPGESRVESFVWIPREGKNVLVFMVDPEDAVCETNETGNTAVMTRFVSGPLEAGSADGGWTAAGAMAAASAGAAAVLAFLGRKGGRRARP